MNTSQHTVLFNLPLPSNDTSPPKPFRVSPKWDNYHVRLPCSIMNQYPVKNVNVTPKNA